MSDETAVDFLADESPDTGDLSTDQEVVTGSDQQDDLIPRRDLDRVRSAEQKQRAKVEQELQAERKRVQEIELGYKRQLRELELTQKWKAQYLAEGHDEQTASYWARKYAAEHVAKEFEEQGLKAKVQTYEQKEQQQQFRQSLAQLRDDVLSATGLSEDQLRQATKGIKPDDPDLYNKVWKQATAFSKTAQAQGQSQTARDIRNRTPFLPGGSAARATYQELPHNVVIGSESGQAFLDEQKRLRRSRGK